MVNIRAAAVTSTAPHVINELSSINSQLHPIASRQAAAAAPQLTCAMQFQRGIKVDPSAT